MEESAQRRERLKAMREEAANYNDMSERSAVSLSNPLLESTATNSEAQGNSFAQSFNYYTDPMAAFSGNKQKSKVSPQIPQDYSSTSQRSRTNEAFPSPSFQSHINRSPNPRMQQPQQPYPNTNYTYTPNPPQGVSFPSPNFDYRGMGWNHNSPHPSPISLGVLSPQPHFTSSPAHGGYPSPHFNHNLARGYPPSPRPNFRNSPNHGSGQGGYPGSGLNHGRGQWSGRGKGQWSGQGRGGGRGRGGGHNQVSAEDRPDMFYDKSMVEDPWKFLEPIVWKSMKKTWIPHSLSVKKARVLESPRQQQQSGSQPSLAEILAASFHEAASDEPNAE